MPVSHLSENVLGKKPWWSYTGDKQQLCSSPSNPARLFEVNPSCNLSGLAQRPTTQTPENLLSVPKCATDQHLACKIPEEMGRTLQTKMINYISNKFPGGISQAKVESPAI